MNGHRSNRKLAALAVAALTLVVAPAAAQAEIGDGFGLADSQGAALPGAKAFWAGTCDLSRDLADAGTAPAVRPDCIDLGTPNTSGATTVPWTASPSWRLASVDEAGAHPDATATFWIKRSPEMTGSRPYPDGNVKDARVELPAGFGGDPTAIPQCPSEFARGPGLCPPETQVGVATLFLTFIGNTVLGTYPVYNAEPRRGVTAEFIINMAAGTTNVPITAEVRTDGDFGVTTMSLSSPSGYPLNAAQVTLWGVPWAAEHDRWRPRAIGTGSIASGGLNAAAQAPYDPSWGSIRPFISNLTECSGESPRVWLKMNSWQSPGTLLSYATDPPPVVDCDVPPFDPSASFAPSATSADAATGLDVEIESPANDAPPAAIARDPSDLTGAPAYWRSEAGRATAQLDRTVVRLPEGLSVNPSAASGLTACSDAQIGVVPGTAESSPPLFTNGDPFDGDGSDGVECPSGSVIGTVEARTPVLEERLTGQLVLGEPKSTDPSSGRMFRLFLVLRNLERGLLAKVHGTATADPGTGRLTAVFDKNPRVPVERIEVSVKGGARGVLATPPSCGTRTTEAVFTPWTAAHGGGGQAKVVEDSFEVAGCANAFAPSLTAGMDSRAARGGGAFSFRFSRKDGEQWFRGLTAKLPTGLLASVKDVPLCTDAQADAGACPQASKIGIVDAAAGAGNPFVLEEKGEVFLTEGYKGGPYGLMVKVRAIAGPFRGAMELSPIIVRQAIHVNRRTAQVTAVSDPFPKIWHGVPLRVREVTVLVNRPDFMLNPSDCEPKRVEADVVSVEGTVASLSNPFQASGCASLPFKPKLALRLSGRKQVRTGKHPGIGALVTQQGVGEAGIEKAVVRLPKSLALDVANAQALCEFEDGTKPDLENRCPQGSIVGRARAVSPLLNDPLVGNVYFVKNVRRDPRTGNVIRTLPMIVAALRGEIAINLVGTSSTTKGGKLVSTFASVPDAPVSRFNLNIRGGKAGIIAVTRTRRAKINICASRQIAESDMDGHNGRRYDRDIRMKTPCTKQQTKNAKRAAKRAAKARKARN